MATLSYNQNIYCYIPEQYTSNLSSFLDAWKAGGGYLAISAAKYHTVNTAINGETENTPIYNQPMDLIPSIFYSQIAGQYTRNTLIGFVVVADEVPQYIANTLNQMPGCTMMTHQQYLNFIASL